jgi:hypothetical protein
MKKILWLPFILTLLFVSHSFAATYNLTAPQPKDTTINATLTGALPGYLYKLVLQTEDFSGNTYTGKVPTALVVGSDTTVKKAEASGGATSATVTWSVKVDKANTLYHMRVLEVAPNAVTGKYITDSSSVTTGGVNIPLIGLTTEKDGSDIVVSGKIDTAKVSSTFNPKDYAATLIYTKNTPLAGATTLTDGKAINARKTDDLDGEQGINADGTYFWRLSSLQPNTTYYIQQTVTERGNPKVDVISHFSSDTGNIVASNSEQATNEASRSYRLLSGFPNFTVLPDPDLCAEQRAAGLNPKFCDMNDVINYFLKLLIGLSAVTLVFRIMYEGFVILTSDIPFKVSSAKGSLFAAMGGLLLAMSSYVILNTINPKLVNSNVGVTQLSLGLDDEIDATPILTSPTGTVPTGSVGKCTEGIASFNTAGGTFWACRRIQTQFTGMMAAAHAAGLDLKGGGFRTATQQIELRKEHCGASNIYTIGAKCTPPTAVPGNSNHESGLAFDLTCDGNKIADKTNKCFVWLQKNAVNYGLKNFALEPWHWSVNGK